MKAGSIFVLACALCEVRMMWRVCVCSEVVGEEGAEGLHSVNPLPPRLFALPGRPHRQPPHPRSPPLHHHLQTMRVKRKNSPQNLNKIYSPSGHLRLEFVSSSKQIWRLSFWRHPFSAEDLLVSKRCNATFLQICYDEETNSFTYWMAWRFLSELFL